LAVNFGAGDYLRSEKRSSIAMFLTQCDRKLSVNWIRRKFHDFYRAA